MGRIADTFVQLKKQGEKALVTFITAGDPDLAATGELIGVLAEAGADIIELGVPFSDPMADGPTIQKSSERALLSGTTLAGILELVREVRTRSQVPIILMGYFNPVFLYGADAFIRDAVDAGVDGVLLVDLPPEEAGDFHSKGRAAGLDVIFLLTPTADDDRMRKVAKMGSGFVYYVSVTGVTGARTSVETSISEKVGAIRRRVSLPLVVGFGISDPRQAAEVASVADGVVVGSALVKLFEQYKGEELKTRLSRMVAALKEGISPC